MRRHFLSSDNTKASLKALLELSGVSVSQIAEKFAVRLESQKKVFLLQLHPSLVKYLGYYFGMYIRGPYSRGLASAYYNLDDVKSAVLRLDNSSGSYISEISAMNNWQLELLATVFSVLEYGKSANNELIITRVRDLKPKYSREEIERAVAKAREQTARYNLRV